MGRDVDKPVVTGAASVGAVTASSGDPVRPDPVLVAARLEAWLRVDRLTSREIEILRCASEAMTTEQTAEWLEISRATVRTHRQNILNKLGVHTLTGAVGMAFRAGALS